MSWPDSHHELMQVVERQKASSGILCSPYFATLQNSEMSRFTFESTQQQFYFAVRFFSRAMAALAARIPDSATRLPLIHNLAEEHGLADEDDAAGSAELRAQDSAGHHHPFHPALAHDRTFRTFLERLRSASPATGQEHIEQSAVRAFNLALWAVCAIEHLSTAFACLGAIEYAFADISALIGNSIVDRGWLSRDKLVHYKLHAEIDKRHAGDFFGVVVNDWADDAAGRHHVESGLSLGFYLFKRLYDDLLTEATDYE
ncbi:MAG: iron-containing redox enzyme family protein [Planctomycetaceae bacterium]